MIQLTHRKRALIALSSILSLGFSFFSWAAIRSPEQDTLEISKFLKPIPDDQWESIAGPKISENYSIVKGDTLYDVSNRLFGDAKYWPKIWALNNKSITNPHWIKPGNIISFSGGSGVSLPSVELAENDQTSEDSISNLGAKNETTTDGIDHFSIYPGKKKIHAKEWKKMPPQEWERFNFILGAETDKNGFDSSTKVTFKTVKGFDYSAVVATEKLNPIAEIRAGRDLSSNFTPGETVYLFSEGNLQIGDSYSVVKSATILSLKDSDRVGFAHTVLGQVKVTGVRDDLFIGTIVWARDTLRRGSLLIPLLPRYEEPVPIPAETAVEGVLLTSKDLTTQNVSQGQTVFIDRGEEDGVKAGMIFRAYQHHDPNRKTKITSGNYLVDGDIQITMTSPKYSMGTVLTSRILLQQGAEVILLTDISEFLLNRGSREKNLDLDSRETKSELDELDQLDSQEGLGKSEEKELKQLERWVEKPVAPVQPEAQPSPPADLIPTPDAPPPPPPPSDVQFPSMEPPPTAPDAGPTDSVPPPPADSKPPTGSETEALDQLLGQ